MLKFKKLSVLMAFVMLFSFAFTACDQTSGNGESKSASESSVTSEDQSSAEPLKIVTTTFPIYDWVRQIVGENSENIELSLLIDTGVDLHSYQATTQDVAEISSADMFIYNGGDSDAWVEEVLESQDTESMKVINLMDALGEDVKVEEHIEGMQETEHDHAEEDEHNHAEEDEHDHAEESGHEDEHIWLSLKNAQILCDEIANEIKELDPQNIQTYDDNATKYIAELGDLDNIFKNEISALENSTLLVADRFPFRYLVDDYDISYYAAFSGCSAETEASFETIVFLSDKINELALTKVVISENSSEDMARTVINSSNYSDIEIVTLDSMQSVTAEQIENGVTYMSIMDLNLVSLISALS